MNIRDLQKEAHGDDGDFDYYEDVECYCSGTGLVVVCIDDICRGNDWCIHGDGMEICPCQGA